MRLSLKFADGASNAETISISTDGPLAVGPGTPYARFFPGLDFSFTISPASKGRYRFKSKTKSIAADGRSVKSTTLGIGEEFVVGFFTVKLTIADSDSDVCLQIIQNPIVPVAERAAMTLAETRISVRFWSYSLLILVFIFGLLYPLVNSSVDVPFALPFAAMAPGETAWSAGELHRAHVTVGVKNDCKACHTAAFEAIPDSACLDCHDLIREHVVITPANDAHFTKTTCADCHQEHIQPSHLVNNSVRACLSCHGKEQDWAPGMPVLQDFSISAHPEFQVSLWEYDSKAKDTSQWQLVKQHAEPGQTIFENSNLKFPHDVHLNSEKMGRDNKGDGLACVNCHQINPADGRVQPISMEANCESCHQLTYDLDQPELVLPHGSEREVIAEMESHFYRKARTEGLLDPQARLTTEAIHQFGDSGCGTCHQVEETPGLPLEARWQIVPVRISDNWFPSASFNHVAHMSVPGISSDSTSCLSCHRADTSHEAKDVLMPEKEVCLPCHGIDAGRNANACISCHVFHTDTGSPAIETRSFRHEIMELGKDAAH